MMPYQHRFRMIGAVVATCVVGVTGCEGMRENPFLSRHFTKDDKSVAAHQRWDHFRGNVRLKMAEQHMQSQRYDEAEKVLLEARDMLPDVPLVGRMLAELHLETGKLDSARREIEAYMIDAPEDAHGFAVAGRIASRDGRLDNAIELFRTAVDRAPDEPDHRLKLAECLMARGEAGQALSIVREASQFDASSPLRQIAMEICDAQGDVDGAAAHARAVSRIAVDDMYLQERAGIILAGSGAHEDAVAVLGPMVQRYVAEWAARSSEGKSETGQRPLDAIYAFTRSCMELGRDAESVDALKCLIRDDASDRVAWSLYCRIAIRAGELSKALEIVRTFNQRNDPVPEMLVLQAYVHFLLGDIEAARNTADKALRVDPGFEPAFLLKARASRDVDERRMPTFASPPPWQTVAGKLLTRRADANAPSSRTAHVAVADRGVGF